MKQTEFLSTLLLLFLLTIFKEVEGDQYSKGVSDNKGSVKLFVFGDSYVDTGNFLKSGAFRQPYGITFPGKPAGRFCDGRVLTDFVASFLRIKSPLPSRLEKLVNKSKLTYGMNFAHGGTGIFDTLFGGPNMTTQIDKFQKVVENKVYTKHDLKSSVSLVNAAGNDYLTFVAKNESLTDIPAFTASLVNQLSINLKRIHRLGVRKIAVALSQPLGCLPTKSAANSYEKCMESANLVAKNHSQMLLQTLQNMNSEMGHQVFVTLDLYNVFLSIIGSMQKEHAGNSALMNPLEPCCVGVSPGYSCGSVDDKGAKKYKICEKRQYSVFWDNIHPSQNGWHAVYAALQSSLAQLIKE